MPYLLNEIPDELVPSHLIDKDPNDNISSYTLDNLPIRKILVTNVSKRTYHRDLVKVFSPYGEVEECVLKKNNPKRIYAFVTFKSTVAVLRLQEHYLTYKIQLHERDLRIWEANSWHQPDSIEYQTRKAERNSKSTPTSTIATDYILNDDAEINKLNDDCLIHVFMYLSIIDKIKIERVCRRWRVVSQESWRTFRKLDSSPSSWGFDKSNTVAQAIDAPRLRKVLNRCGKFLSHIDLSTPTKNLGTSTLTIISRLCPNLQHIHVTGLPASTAGILALAANYHNITELSLGECRIMCDTDLSELFLKNRKLRYLKFMNNELSGRCLLNLPTDSIEVIILDNCKNISPKHFNNAIQRLDRLHTLSLNICSTLDNESLEAVSLCSKSLKELSLTYYHPMIFVSSMIYIADLVNLETLNLRYNVSIRDEVLVIIARECKQLKSVDISCCNNVTNIGLEAINTLPNLQHLYINALMNITDKVFTEMVNLRTMHCICCDGLRDEGLCRLIKESQQLELLDLSGCKYLTNKLAYAAMDATINRTNNTVLTMYVHGTQIPASEITNLSPFLKLFCFKKKITL